ncbi:hypothetical protein LXL04_011912 [Taraxacum kok-saghyz]
MALELLNYINMDLNWNTVKKGRRSMTRHPRKIQDKTPFETNKLVDAPLKKRKVTQSSPSPAGPQTPSFQYEDPSQRYHSNSLSQSQKTKSKTRLRNKTTSKKAHDFSGIQLLADAACSSLIHDYTDDVNDEKVLKEGKISLSTKLDGSLNPDTLHDDGNQKTAASCSKELRLHWDLNTVMDDWEEVPCTAEVSDVPLTDSFKKTHEDLVTKTVTSKTSDCESCVTKSDLSTSTTSVLKEETIIKDGGPIMSTSDPPSECCGDYDSPFEDGELREENAESNNITTTENPLLEKVNHSQTNEDESSLLVKDTAIVQQNVPQSRCSSSNIGSCYPPSSSTRTWDHHRSKNATRSYDYRRPLGYYDNNNNNRATTNRYRYHSQDYNERKARCYSPKRRSGSPISWHFQKRKNSVTQCVDRVSHESFDERKFTDGTQFRRRVGYPDRIKSDDSIRFSQQGGRYSSYKYKDDGYTTRK